MSDADIDSATPAIQQVESSDGHESDTASNSSYETAVPPGSPRNLEHENDVDRESTVSTLVTLPSGYGLSRWKPWKSWKRRSTAKESVRAAIRDFVLRHHGFCGPRPFEEARGIIDMCKATCAELSISLPYILQDRYINKHSPLYWAIDRKEKTSKDPQSPGVKSVNIFTTLLPLALPITSGLVISELREVCRVVSENKAFQRLRFDVPGFSKVEAYRSTKGKPRSDEVKVITWNHVYGNLFNVDMTFPDFSERLRARRTIGAEFVVRDRIWKFLFAYRDLAYEHCNLRCWTAQLTIEDSSPPTWFSGYLVLVLPPSSSRAVASRRASQQDDASLPSVKPIRLGTKNGPLNPWYGTLWSSLDESPGWTSLRYPECSYLSEDGTLHVKLEARLGHGHTW